MVHDAALPSSCTRRGCKKVLDLTNRGLWIVDLRTDSGRLSTSTYGKPTQISPSRFWDAPIRGAEFSLIFRIDAAQILGFANQERHFQPSRLVTARWCPLEMAFQADDLQMP